MSCTNGRYEYYRLWIYTLYTGRKSLIIFDITITFELKLYNRLQTNVIYGNGFNVVNPNCHHQGSARVCVEAYAGLHVNVKLILF